MISQAETMKEASSIINLKRVKIDNEYFFQITNHDFMRPFFMSIVSDSNHWMFISSNGGVTAGRKNSEYALFPYYTDDKITESSEITGNKSLFRVEKGGTTHVWEPFSIRSDGFYNTTRNLYKNTYGNKVLFEEINHDLQLTFRYQWNSSNRFGFVKRAWLVNNSYESTNVSLLDGIQNIVPAGVGSNLQNQSSNLVDAYKRSELAEEVGLGVFALSAIIVDKAEPSEALKTNVAWSLGIDNPIYLLSSAQLKNFRKGMPMHQEIDIKAEKGAYFVHSELNLQPEEEKTWMIIADVNKDHSALVKLIETIKTNDGIEQEIKDNIELGTKRLIELNASSDGLQLTADKFRDARHFSNSLFNIMRGGVFDYNYQIERWDLKKYLKKANRNSYNSNKKVIDNLPELFTYFDLKEVADSSKDSDFRRLCKEYLPLKFSRRHGDPSRPWNKFSINTRSEVDGSKILDYEGNWRDIFQNWEALAQSFPSFTESMIHKFLNTSTFEGYNPYRVTKEGYDWETIEPDNPWSYIGYWGDHQIIYLLKLLEITEKHYPGQLATYFEDECFVYANVPYKIKSYREILNDPKDTMEFDEELDNHIRKSRKTLGADAALLFDENQEIYKVNFIEKILTTVLAKLSNFIPDGGIWMNTQRPEWNDANNALVGNGVSMVTLYYLRRFLNFFKDQLEDITEGRVAVSNELIIAYKRIRSTFEEYLPLLSDGITNKSRKRILDGLNQAGSDYREHIYKQGFWGKKRTISYAGLNRFFDLSLEFIDHSIKANKREDNLYHAYNLMTLENSDEISIAHLSEMLEGQVAVLSSGCLTAVEALEVLDALKQSKLFREDQYSYLLYPRKELVGFIERNIIPKEEVEESKLLTQLVAQGNTQIISQDIKGEYHFNGNFKNAGDLDAGLDGLVDTEFEQLAKEDRKIILSTFEQVFNHKAFTGRSGTFYGYEGLGSIYWHMVSKLQLAVQEVALKAVEQNEDDSVIGRLLEHYYEINAGIGVHKSPELYGAFPTDPYSHTPFGRGAQQPGMTGQVKEDVLSRFGELGAFVEDGVLMFNPCLLRKDEFIVKPRVFNYVDIHKEHKQMEMQIGSLCFSYCQVPVVYKLAHESSIVVHFTNGKTKSFNSDSLDKETSTQIFERTGEVDHIIVEVNESDLK